MDTGQILADILVAGEMRIHLIGVAGSGMSGIAGLLLALGHRVSGSDKVATIETDRLQELGPAIFLAAHGRGGARSPTWSSFPRPSSPATSPTTKRTALGKMMVRRADALAAVMHRKRGIVVAGMHGKTTTSSMAAHVLRAGGLQALALCRRGNPDPRHERPLGP